MHTFCVRPDNNKDDKNSSDNFLKVESNCECNREPDNKSIFMGILRKSGGLRRETLAWVILWPDCQRETETKKTEASTNPCTRITVNNKLKDSNLVIENRTLSRFIKPMSGRIVNKVNIATLERKDIRGQFQNQHF